MRRLRETLGSWPLHVRAFRLLLAAQITSSLGDYVYAVALPWYVLSGDGGPVLLSGILASFGVSRVAGIAAGGILADRFGATRVMLVVDGVRGTAALALGLIAATSPPSITVLAVLGAVLGFAGGVFLPASYVILPSILSERDLSAGNALSTMVTQAGGLFGPVLGGAIVAAVSAWPAFLVDAGTFLVSAMVLAMIGRTAPLPADPPADTATPAAAGPAGPTFTQVLRHGQILRVVLIVGLIGNLVFAGAAEVALPTLAHDSFGPRGYGSVLTAVALGLIVGALLARWVTVPVRPAYLIFGLGLLMALSMATVPFAGGWFGAAVCLFLFSTGNGWSSTLLVTMLQIWAPRALLGRVMSVVTLAITGVFPLSVMLAGLGVGRLGVAPFFVVAGGAIALGVTVALTQPAFRRYRDGDHFALPTPADPTVVPHPADRNGVETSPIAGRR
ncbi:MFS transporter [Micromonospora rifamycinica]|uniref:MFS transporter n=1 Tax=Micromonospora rifamycinica TaxID=291594 RepID=UPI002E282B6F|nr:MFS transporter [Micromonospora rifamycinica]